MEIPIYRQRNSIPASTGGVYADPGKMAQPFEAQAQAGAQLAKTGFEGLEMAQRFKAAEERADRVVEAQRLENTLKNAFQDAQIGIDQNGDYKQFESYAENQAAEIRAQHIDGITDPIVKRAAETVWLNQTGDLRRYAKVNKVKLQSQESLNLFNNDIEQTATRMANTTDEAVKQYERDRLKMKGYELESARTIQPGTTDKVMLGLDQKAEAIYAGTMINNNAEVAYSYLRERNEDGSYKNLLNLQPEERIRLINNAERGMSAQRTENLRQWGETKDNWASTFLNARDKKTMSPQRLLAEVDKAEQTRDPKTGERLLDPVSASNLRHSITNGSGSNKGDIVAFVKWKERISEDDTIKVDNILADGRLSDGQINALTDDILGKKKEKSREEKLVLAQKDGIYKEAAKTVDAIFPNSGDTKITNAALKSRLFDMRNEYKGIESIESYQRFASSTLDWAKKNQTDSKRSNQRLTKMLLATDMENAAKVAPSTGKAQAAQPTTNNQKTQWMNQARTQNPGTSDAELSAYYDKKYGAK